MKKAVILFNLGGPDKLENVEPFLFNLFNDPGILNLPSIIRFPLAKLIAKRRSPVAKEIYRELGVPFENQFLDFKTQKIFVEEFNLKSNLEIHYLGKQFDQKPVGHFFVFDKGDRIDFNHPNGQGHYVLAREIVSRKLCY